MASFGEGPAASLALCRKEVASDWENGSGSCRYPKPVYGFVPIGSGGGCMTVVVLCFLILFLLVTLRDLLDQEHSSLRIHETGP